MNCNTQNFTLNSETKATSKANAEFASTAKSAAAAGHARNTTRETCSSPTQLVRTYLKCSAKNKLKPKIACYSFSFLVNFSNSILEPNVLAILVRFQTAFREKTQRHGLLLTRHITYLSLEYTSCNISELRSLASNLFLSYTTNSIFNCLM